MERTRVGILGGGQLARMLAEAALRLGLHPVVLVRSDSGDSEPASQVGAELCRSLDSLLETVSVVAFENEFISRTELEAAAARITHPLEFRPSLAVMAQVHDKLEQKRVLAELGIPTSPYEVYDERAPLAPWIERMGKRFAGGVVFKWSKYGYDGKGTWLLREGDRATDILEWAEPAITRGSRLYAEEKIAFKREVAALGTLSIRGEYVSWPLVISRQEQGICRLVTGPATALGVAPAVEAEAARYAETLARRLGLVGTAAVEMFETDRGGLWVNELAPRVHNTGHYTLDASDTSQFENHWRGLLGMPLGSTRTRSAFAMLNLLGPAASVPRAPEAGLTLHWYGKKELIAGRKLGHVTAVAESPASICEEVRKLEKYERDWRAAKGT